MTGVTNRQIKIPEILLRLASVRVCRSDHARIAAEGQGTTGATKAFFAVSGVLRTGILL
jgi:hypothetical protein